MFQRSLKFCSFKYSSCMNFYRIQKFRKFSTKNCEKISLNYIAIKLNDKRLLRVSGCDSFIYLQSLLTNDMRRLLPLDRLQDEAKNNMNLFQEIYSLNQPVIYSYICSAVGKVLCDMFVYRSRCRAEDGEYILEVDAKIATAIKRLLLGYNLSRNVKVEFADDFDLWSLIPEENFFGNADQIPNVAKSELIEIDSDDIKLVSDPRIPKNNFLGYRFLTRLGGKNIRDIGKYCKLTNSNLGKLCLAEAQTLDYTQLRYRYGITEGIFDNLSGHYFPFELNGDLLNAVALNKGLYTSEEKIIKIYSNQGIKRRIFPIVFTGSKTIIRHRNPAPRTILSTKENKKFGELRQRVGRFGIANLLVPMKNNFFPQYSSKRMPMLKHIDTGLNAKIIIPSWWPQNLEDPQLPIPEYPKCLFANLKAPQIRYESLYHM